jgi:hypothetical protein
MTDEARAVAEVAKATGEIVKAAGGVGSYLARVFQSIPDNVLGLMVGDWLDHKRRRHLAELEANTARILQGIAPERLTEASPSVLIPLLQAAVDEARPELQALWTALLANAMVDDGRKVRRDFFDTVGKMEPADAFIFNAAGDFAPGNVNNPGAIRQHIAEKARQASMSDIDVQVSVDALTALRCFERDYVDQPRMTPFGKALLTACRPPT